MIRTIAITLALGFGFGVGCKSQEPPAPMKCEEIIPPAIDRIMADHATDPRVVAVLPRTKQEMVGVCTRDKWSGGMGKCIEKAKDRAAMDQCRGGLDDKQKDHLLEVNARLRGAIEQSTAPTTAPQVPEAPASGSGSGATGSATGSTGSAK